MSNFSNRCGLRRLLVVLFSVCLAWSQAAGALESGEVVVASYNLENYLRMERRVDGKMVDDAPKPEEEISAAIEVIREINPDILGLVEMGDEAMLADLQARLKAAGLDYPHKEWVKGADKARHLALLSRLPIVARNSQDEVPFELNGVRTRIGRGILDVTVKLAENAQLRLVGAHLKSRREVPEFDQAAMRAKEAWFLREYLNKILEANPEEKLMLFGDLNDTKNEYAVKELMGSAKDPFRMKDLFLTDRYGYRWTHYWSAADIYSRIDFMLVSTGLWPEINMEKSGISSSRIWYKASDHRAIFSTIKLPAK
ncbi:MAG: endonuclease/exonuclease/phosphatase family protein [Terrimicrobiaceae bacterium]